MFSFLKLISSFPRSAAVYCRTCLVVSCLQPQSRSGTLYCRRTLAQDKQHNAKWSEKEAETTLEAPFPENMDDSCPPKKKSTHLLFWLPIDENSPRDRVSVWPSHGFGVPGALDQGPPSTKTRHLLGWKPSQFTTSPANERIRLYESRKSGS